MYFVHSVKLLTLASLGRSHLILPHFPILRVGLVSCRVGIRVLRVARRSAGKWKRRMVLAEASWMVRGFESRER